MNQFQNQTRKQMYTQTTKDSDSEFQQSGNQHTIYQQHEASAEENPYLLKDDEPPFLKWCKKILKSFKHGKIRNRANRWLPQWRITVEKEIIIDDKSKEITLDIPFHGNTNDPVDHEKARRIARKIARGLIGSGNTITISGSTPSNQSADNDPNSFFTIDGVQIPREGNLDNLVNSRATALERLLLEAGVPPDQITIGNPIYNSIAEKPYAAIATISNDEITRKTKRKVKHEFIRVPVGAGKHQLIRKIVKPTRTTDNR